MTSAYCSDAVLADYDQGLSPLRENGAVVKTFSSPFSYGDLADENGTITAIEAYFNHGHRCEQTELPMDEDARKRVMFGKTHLAFAYLELL